MHDIGAHSSLQTAAIFMPTGKKEERRKILHGWHKRKSSHILMYLALHKCIPAVLKVSMNADANVYINKTA